METTSSLQTAAAASMMPAIGPARITRDETWPKER